MENTITSKSFKRKAFLIGALVFLGVVFQCGLFAQSYKNLDQLYDKSFTVNSGENLKLKADMGDVIVGTWDKDEVSVKVYGNDNAKNKLEYNFEKTSDGVEVTVKKEGFGFFNSFRNYKLVFDIKVPKKFNAYVSTSGGDVQIDDMSGYAKVSTSGGDISVAKLYGDMSLTTSGGDIHFAETNGKASVSTSGGDIQSENHKGEVDASTSGGDVKLSVIDGKVNSSTSGGDIKLYYKGSNKGIRLSTSGGDVHVSLPKDFAAAAELHTTGGDITCEINTTKTTKISSSKYIAEFNGGGELFKCTTTGGDISVSSN